MDLIKKGLNWILGNGQKINFWHDILFKDYPLTNKVNSNKIKEINVEVKVGDFIDKKRTGS